MTNINFDGGVNIALKIPARVFEQTRQFYAETLGLSIIDEGEDYCSFKFGPNVLWIDKVDALGLPEVWLETVVDDTEAAKRHLVQNGGVVCNEVEQLPDDLDGFWTSNPAGIIHLVNKR